VNFPALKAPETSFQSNVLGLQTKLWVKTA